MAWSVSLDDFKNQIQTVQTVLDNYPSNIIKYLFNNFDFKGFFVGYEAYENAHVNLLEVITYAAYAQSNEYIYINNDWNSPSTITHELAHILDAKLANGSG